MFNVRANPFIIVLTRSKGFALINMYNGAPIRNPPIITLIVFFTKSENSKEVRSGITDGTDKDTPIANIVKAIPVSARVTENVCVIDL